MAVYDVKSYESVGSGGNKGDSYWNGKTSFGLNNLPVAYSDSVGDQSALNGFDGSGGNPGGTGGYPYSTTGTTGTDGEINITWPVEYFKESNGRIQYGIIRGGLPKSGTIRFSDLAQLGRDSDGVRLSSYYRGSQYAPTAGQYSSSFPYTSSTGQKNLGNYRITISLGILGTRGFSNRLNFSYTGSSASVTIPNGVRYFQANLYGAGGGGGGGDYPGTGGNGGRGHFISGRADKGTTDQLSVTINVGGGGPGGTYTGGGGGGIAVTSGRPGANGGASGTYGQSGGGGAGGGASYISAGSNLYVAAGGGGGGGAARSSDNPYKNGGSYYNGTIDSGGLPGTYFITSHGLSFNEVGYYEGTLFTTDGGGCGGGGGGVRTNGASGGRQGGAPPVLTTYDDNPSYDSGGGGY